MTPAPDGLSPDAASPELNREDIQRRVEELLADTSQQEETARKRRRAVLAAVLILLLILICAVAAFVYRFLNPGSGASEDETAGITWIRSIYGYGPAEDQQLVNPNDAATDPDGNIWVSDPAKVRVLGFRSDGSYVGTVLGSETTGEPFRLPSQIAFDSNGAMYVADRGNDQLTIVDGQQKLASTHIPGLTTVATSDELTVVGSESGFAILDKDGNVQKLVGTRGAGENQFDTVPGVAIDSERKTIYVVDLYNNRLSAWDYTGNRKWIVTLGNPANETELKGGASLPTTTTAPAAIQLPVDVTVDGRGRPMILDGFGFSISAFDPKDGKFIKKWGAYGDKDGQFMYPSALQYDASKDWFTVADTSNRRAQIIRIAGTSPEGAAGVVAGLRRLLAGPLRALWPCLVFILLALLALLFARARRRRREKQEAAALASNTEEASPALEEI